MKDSKKQAACLNCGRPLAEPDNFCPHCGQENTVQNFALPTLLSDFFSNYFSFDSKLTRSVVPFLVKPGFLTQRFNEGKRVSYVHPLRLYFIISFFFFLFLSLLIDTILIENKVSIRSAIQFDNSVSQEILSQKDTSQFSAKQKEGFKNFKIKAEAKEDSLRQYAQLDEEERAFAIMRNDTLTDEEVLTQLDMQKSSSFNKMLLHQARKILKKDIDVFLPYLIKNLSIMMFLLLPVFAFYLFILFRRRERYYLKHLIHALHLHSFSFLLLTIAVLLGLLINTSTLFGWIAFMLITVYAFFSVKRVYGQGWLRTFWKFNVLGFFYFTTIFVAILLEVGISFIFF